MNQSNRVNYKKQLNHIVQQLAANETPTGIHKIFYWCYQVLFCVIFFFSLLLPLIIMLLIDVDSIINRIRIPLLIFTYGFLALFIIYGAFIRKQIMISRFYKIKNGHQYIHLIKVEDTSFLDELYQNSALTFFAEPVPELLDFIYNWLNNKQVLKEESVNMYLLTGKHLKDKYKYRGLDDHITILCIMLKDLNLNDENMISFSREHFAVGARWFDDIIDNK